MSVKRLMWSLCSGLRSGGRQTKFIHSKEPLDAVSCLSGEHSLRRPRHNIIRRTYKQAVQTPCDMCYFHGVSPSRSILDIPSPNTIFCLPQRRATTPRRPAIVTAAQARPVSR